MTLLTPHSLKISGLTIVTPRGRPLLQDAAFEVGEAEIVLVVGRSASGKSTLVSLLCGLLGPSSGWRVSGRMETAGRVVDLAQERPAVGGLVFQRDALLDEFTGAENLRIVLDHAGGAPPEAIAGAARLLAEIDPQVAVTDASGGMRQRIAIARTLLSDHHLVLLDEPNSGLDIGAEAVLAETLRQTRDTLRRPLVIVAHHVDALMEIADRVYLFDDREKRLRPLPRDAQAVKAALAAVSVGPETDRPVTLTAEWQALLKPQGRARWFLRYFAEYAWSLCAHPLIFAYVALGGAIIGGVTTWFAFNYQSVGRYLISLLHDETLAGLGYSQMTIAVPLMTSVMLAARNAAIVSADLGNRFYAQQFRAMRNLGVPGAIYIPLSIGLAMVLSFILLCGIGMGAAGWASYLTWSYTFPGVPQEVWRSNFFRLFSTRQHPIGYEAAWIVGKVGLSGLATAVAAMLASLASTRSPLAINRVVGFAIVATVTLTLLIHAAAIVAKTL
jgi:ABC-type multidrug transport system ATPase subunit/ABC-type transporter Mla maintaining outer membrane lipid asymmetry permease subunit MlaE